MTNYDGWLDQDSDEDTECENCGGCRVDSRGDCVECGESVLTDCSRCHEFVRELDDDDLCETCAACANAEET